MNGYRLPADKNPTTNLADGGVVVSHIKIAGTAEQTMTVRIMSQTAVIFSTIGTNPL
jgi:hypothetical protein